MAAASEELNGAGTPGGGVGREDAGDAESKEAFLAFAWGSFFIFVIFSTVLCGPVKEVGSGGIESLGGSRPTPPPVFPFTLFASLGFSPICSVHSRSAVDGPGGGDRGC